MRAHRRTTFITFAPDPYYPPSALVNIRCNRLNEIFLYNDPAWLELFRKRTIIDAMVVGNLEHDEAFWIVDIRGLKSDVSEEDVDRLFDSVTGMQRPPFFVIQDWPTKRGRKKGYGMGQVLLKDRRV